MSAPPPPATAVDAGVRSRPARDGSLRRVYAGRAREPEIAAVVHSRAVSAGRPQPASRGRRARRGWAAGSSHGPSRRAAVRAALLGAAAPGWPAPGLLLAAGAAPPTAAGLAAGRSTRRCGGRGVRRRRERRRWRAGHRGVDLRAAGPATRVHRPAAGVVAFAGRVAGRGVVVGRPPGGLRTTYEPVAATVARGDPVARRCRSSAGSTGARQPLPASGLPALGAAAGRRLSRPAVAARCGPRSGCCRSGARPGTGRVAGAGAADAGPAEPPGAATTTRRRAAVAAGSRRRGRPGWPSALLRRGRDCNGAARRRGEPPP